jgi:ketosteroid isomerase-like protein
MADEDVEVVRRAYEAYSKGELVAAGAAYSEDTVWDVTRFRPDEGVHHGLAELTKYIVSWLGTWTDHSFTVESLVDAGAVVVYRNPEDAFAAAGVPQ